MSFEPTIDFNVSENHPDVEINSKWAGWLYAAAEVEGSAVKLLSYTFVTDDELLALNKEYLNHDYYTDILTFPLTDQDDGLEGDIYISLPRVKENAETLGEDYDREVRRVMIHGLLHLVGYDDRTDDLKEEMRDREDFYLNAWLD